MLHSGYFRSNDTSEDPRGQLYKVEIFTEGKLYTYRNLFNIPFEESIELSDRPFVVDYSNDDNKYKSYKGSSASIGIMMDNYGFIAKGKCDIYVQLLKWKNEVVDYGEYMYNTKTWETLNKKNIFYWRGFVPAEVDNFAYDVEWCGYATPNVFNQGYTNPKEEYILECQDVLTTLQYFDYVSEQRGTSTFLDTIRDSLNTLPHNPLKKLYVTNTKRNPDKTTSILQQLSTINDNWINESFEKNDCLEVIDNIMSYSGLTILQHKDNIYITTPDAIGTGKKYYYEFELHPEQNLWVREPARFGDIREIDFSTEPASIEFPTISRTDWWHLVGKDIEISDGELGSANTKISTTNTYKKAKIITDEYYDSNLIIDINDDDRLEERFRWDDTLNYMKLDPDDPVDRNIWSHDYPYNYNMVNATAIFQGSCYDVIDNDVDDDNYASITQYYYPRDTKTEDDEGWMSVQHFETTSKPQSRSDIFFKVGCSIVDYNVQDTEQSTAYQQYMDTYNGNRAFLFHNTAEQVEAGSAWELNIAPLMLNPSKLNSAAYAQKVLTMKSKKVYMKSNQSINIQGNLEFFQTISLPISAGWNVDELKAYKNYMFIWCRLKVHNSKTGLDYFVTNNSGTGSYTWQTSDTWFKLWYDNFIGYDTDADSNDRGTTTVYAFENMFQFSKNTRGVDGTCIALPSAFDSGSYEQIEFEMRRPWGCGREDKITSWEHFYPAQYCIMTNFKINVIDTSETTFRYQAEENNQFNVDVNNLGVDDFENSLLVSSDYYKNTSKATVIGLPDDMCIDDTATGSALFPEANYLLNIEKSYATSKLKLEVTLPYEVHPLDRITWNTQMEDKNYAVDRMSIDYAYNLYNLELIETNLDEVSADIYSEKKTKNFRRNGDNLYNPLPRRNKKKLQSPREKLLYNATFTVNENAQVICSSSDRQFPHSSKGTLLKHIWFEPTNNSRELTVSHPDYMDEETQNVTYQINNDGELIISYTTTTLS